MLKLLTLVFSVLSSITAAHAYWDLPGQTIDPEAIHKIRACDPAVNPFLAAYESSLNEADLKFTSILEKYRMSAGLPKAETCREFPEAERSLCTEEMNALLGSILSPRMQQKITSIFHRAQNDLISYLKRRYALFPDDLPRHLTLSRMVKRVENFQFTVMQAASTGSSTDEVSFFQEVLGAMPPSVIALSFIHAMLAETAPQALYFVILHELGHSIDLDTFRLDAGYSENPFSQELQCLKRSDSVGAKAHDLACLQQAGSDYLVKSVKQNPDRRLGHGYECQRSQLNEAFSDWLATEVTGLQMVWMTPNEARDAALQTSVFHCHYLAGVNRNWSQLKPEEKRYLLLEEHPTTEDRFNRIFLAHPLVRYHYGYSHGPYFTLGQLSAPTNDAVVYCGTKLY